MSEPNDLQRQLAQLDEVPALFRSWYRNVVLRRSVPFARTAGVKFVALTPERVEASLDDEPRVHNQSRDLHVSAIHLLAETATRLAVGLNVRDGSIPLLRSSRLVFRQRATGEVRAVAQLNPAQRAELQTLEQGEVNVAVTLTDATGASPLDCEFIWAWTPSGPRKN
ncbi:DUF4442 domain-containing protein [Variovorax terrae]|uniref:DUF4442 domain-containing protein n=1 Tax=Variovorax terrae TaxID=2923278 RepID=A0A9X1VRA6_9BURK|nr:DUF4442 domain-containing protein [Variovorax terrae]MCJ0761893.1 DUF4442 domain-containing protein [Variovorax terrae]